MNTNLLNTLKEIVSRYGIEMLSNAKRVNALLADLAAAEPRPQKKALVTCIERGFATPLQNAPAHERGQVKAKLTERLNHEEGLDPVLCADTLDLLEAALFGEEAPQTTAQIAAYPAVQNTPDLHSGGIAESVSYTLRTNTELLEAAKSQLRGSYLDAVKITFVYTLLMTVSSYVLGVLSLIIYGPLTMGFCGYFLYRSRKENYSFGNLFDGFNSFGKTFLLGLLNSLFIFLWALLLIVPGIAKACSYAMSFFIMKDNPSMNALNAITESKRMMQGHRWQFFCLYFSFFGWALLCILSLGIGFLWLIPYMQLAFANFYIDVRQRGNNRA
jgi:uncharacterized membrane protein